MISSRIDIERALRDQHARALYALEPDHREETIDRAWELWEAGERNLDDIWQAVGEPPEREYDEGDYWDRYGQEQRSRIA